MIPVIFKALVVVTTFIVGVVTKEVVMKDQETMRKLAASATTEVVQKR